jgi:N-acetylglutamate synthase-like GNAT family acetyltransferase
VIGWVHVGLYPSLAADDAAELRGLVVSAQWQRQGIGRQLLIRTYDTKHRYPSELGE